MADPQINERMQNLVAIVGRPNVGKSTLFNRLTQSRQAIVTETAGTTRDRQYGQVNWNGQEFSLVDTGGWVVNSDDVMEEEINKQVHIAMEEADVILFVVDVMNGLTDLDTNVAQMLRRSGKPVVVVSNKSDNFDLGHQAAEFYALGLGDPSVSRPSMALARETCSIISSPFLQSAKRKSCWMICPSSRWWDVPMPANPPSSTL